MRRTALLALVLLVLADCAGNAVTTPCPDPDPNPVGPCATSHSHTYDGGGKP